MIKTSKDPNTSGISNHNREMFSHPELLPLPVYSDFNYNAPALSVHPCLYLYCVTEHEADSLLLTNPTHPVLLSVAANTRLVTSLLTSSFLQLNYKRWL